MGNEGVGWDQGHKFTVFPFDTQLPILSFLSYILGWCVIFVAHFGITSQSIFAPKNSSCIFSKPWLMCDLLVPFGNTSHIGLKIVPFKWRSSIGSLSSKIFDDQKTRGPKTCPAFLRWKADFPNFFVLRMYVFGHFK